MLTTLRIFFRRLNLKCHVSGHNCIRVVQNRHVLVENCVIKAKSRDHVYCLRRIPSHNILEGRLQCIYSQFVSLITMNSSKLSCLLGAEVSLVFAAVFARMCLSFCHSYGCRLGNRFSLLRCEALTSYPLDILHRKIVVTPGFFVKNILEAPKRIGVLVCFR